jgi:hypothetical protein
MAVFGQSVVALAAAPTVTPEETNGAAAPSVRQAWAGAEGGAVTPTDQMTPVDPVPPRPGLPSLDAELLRVMRPDYEPVTQRAPGEEAGPAIVVVQTSLEDLTAVEITGIGTALDSAGESLLAPPLQTSFQGTIDDWTFIPPDTDGAVGPNHVAQLLNNGWQVFTRAGVVVSPLVSLDTFWSVLGTGPGAGVAGGGQESVPVVRAGKRRVHDGPAGHVDRRPAAV